MITRLGKYNESIRDLMTPKSLDNVLNEYIKPITKLDEYRRNYICKVFGEPPENVYYVLDQGEKGEYGVFLEVSEVLHDIPNWGNVVRREYNDISLYPDVKIGYDFADAYGNASYWFFTRDRIAKIKGRLMELPWFKKKMGLDESIRDLMTPKNEVDINKAIVKRMNIYPELGEFNPFTWGFVFNEKTSAPTDVFVFDAPDGRMWSIVLWGRTAKYPISIRETQKSSETEYRTNNYGGIESFLRNTGYVENVNESIRDKMTGKEDKAEEWRNSIMGITEDFKEHFGVRATHIDYFHKKVLYGFGQISEGEVRVWFRNLGVTKYVIMDIGYTTLPEPAVVVSFMKRNKVFGLVDDNKVIGFVDESVKDQMRPKPKKELYDVIDSLPKWQRWSKVKEMELEDIYLDAEIEIMQKDANESLRDKMTPISKAKIDAIDFTKIHYVDRFYKGVKYGLLPWVQHAIAESPSVVRTAHLAILDAVNSGDVEMLQYLISNGMRVSIDNERPLRTAVRNNNVEVVKLLLDAGADKHNDKVLDLWDMYQDLEAYKFMIDYNSKVNESVRDMMKPIDKNKYDEFIKQFNNHYGKILGAKQGMVDMIISNFDINDIEKELDEFINPVDMAFWLSDKSNYGQIYTHDKVNALTKDRLKELFNRLVKNTNESVGNTSVKDLMLPKSEEDLRRAVESLPSGEKLLKGCLHGFMWLIEEALSEGVDVNYTSKLGSGALEIASINGHLDIIKLLVGKGLDINRMETITSFGGKRPDRSVGSLALCWACVKGHEHVVRYLLESGIIPDLENWDKWSKEQITPYMYRLLRKYIIKESLHDSLTGKPVEHIDNVHNFRRYNFIEPWADDKKYRNHVGYIVIDDEYKDELYLSSFTIWEPYKGKGLGRKYLNIVLEDLKEFSQYPWIGLSVKRDNEVAIKLYRSVGFRLADEVEEYNGAGKNYKNELYYYMVKENK